MTTDTTGGPATRFGPRAVAWLLALAVSAACFGYVVGVNDRPAAAIAGR